MSDTGQEPWHLKREVNLGHLIMTVSIVIGALVWGSRLEQRVAVIEATAAQNSLVLQERLNRIEDKLDKLIQRELNGGRSR